MKGAVGLDLSLKRTGACYIPPWWEGDLSGLVCESFSTERGEAAYGDPAILARLNIERRLKVVKFVVGFIMRAKETTPKLDVVKEGYAHSTVRDGKGRPVQSASVTKLAELSGSVEDQIYLALGIPVIPVASNTARKWLSGGLKKGKQKEQVDRLLQSRGFRFDDWDQMDAFVAAYFWWGKMNNVESLFRPQQSLNFG